MTSAQMTQYYTFLQRIRRQAIANQSLTHYNIYTLKNYIKNGINPADVPELSAEFWRLINEFGTKLFAAELSDELNLTFEDDTSCLVPIT